LLRETLRVCKLAVPHVVLELQDAITVCHVAGK